jgi:phasin family protein
VAAKPAAKPVPPKTPAAVVKAPVPIVKAPPAVAKVAAAKPAVVRPVAVKAPVPKAVAPKVEPAKVAAPVPTLIENSPAPIAPLVEVAVAAPPVKPAAAVVTKMPVSKPVEAPVSSFIAPKASTIPPTPQFKVSFMSTQSFKGYEDFAAFGKANLEAFVQANTLFAKGIESLSKEVVSLAQSSLESSTAATKAMFAAKTLKDVVELQADFAKTSFEKLVANSTKLGEMTVKLATDSAAPIGARVTAASEKALKPTV